MQADSSGVDSNLPLKQEAPAVHVVEPQVEDPSLHKITSPMVGTFYAASSPDSTSICTNRR